MGVVIVENDVSLSKVLTAIAQDVAPVQSTVADVGLLAGEWELRHIEAGLLAEAYAYTSALIGPDSTASLGLTLEV